jgi:hypothetical protein
MFFIQFSTWKTPNRIDDFLSVRCVFFFTFCFVSLHPSIRSVLLPSFLPSFASPPPLPSFLLKLGFVDLNYLFISSSIEVFFFLKGETFFLILKRGKKKLNNYIYSLSLFSLSLIKIISF